jgi:hypothetical protein
MVSPPLVLDSHNDILEVNESQYYLLTTIETWRILPPDRTPGEIRVMNWGALNLLIQKPTIVPGLVTANWNSGLATSGQPGADLFTFGTVNRWWRLTDAYLLLAAFNAGATVTVRAYMNLMGAEREIMDDNWVVALDPAVIFLTWFWEVQIYGPIRIEVFSDQAADDGLAVPYEYRHKQW